eukprot:scaffold229113_cov26-Tisochrysis_lutea.AAC.1
MARSSRLLHRLSSLPPRPRLFSTAAEASSASTPSLFSPTPEHAALRSLVSSFVQQEVEPQALQYNREETFNLPLFRRAGELGLLGVTVDPEYGGAGMDALGATIVHEELSYSDPAFCLSYLAHSQLFVNNLARNGNAEQRAAWLPAACSGEAIGGMGMSEPDAGTVRGGGIEGARREWGIARMFSLRLSPS